jgi:polyisoprenoid-binding protein YceI
VYRAAVALLLLLALPLAAAERYEIDPAHAFVTFAVPHFLLDDAAGSFRDVSGTLVVDPDVAKCSVRVVVQAASIDTNVNARDKHLRSADFFDVEKYPEIVFTSTSIAKARDGYVATGALALHGVTKTVTVPFRVFGPIADPLPLGVKRMGVRAQLTIDRRDYGIVWNRALDDGTLFVGNDVKLTIHFEAVIPKAKPTS